MKKRAKITSKDVDNVMAELGFLPNQKIVNYKKADNGELTEENYSNLYEYYDLRIFYSGLSYVSIEGKISYKFAQEFFEKYSSPIHGIRILGAAQAWHPYQVMTNEFLDELYNAFHSEGMIKACSEFKYAPQAISETIKYAKDFFVKNDPDSLYIEGYNIDNKDALRIFLKEYDLYIENKIKEDLSL